MNHIKRERKKLEMLSFHPFPRSGAGLSAEDATNGTFHVQMKITSQKTYKLSTFALQKLEAHAALHGEHPLFIIFFTQANTYIVLFPHRADDENENIKVVNKCIKLSPTTLYKTGGKMFLHFRGTNSNPWCAMLIDAEQIYNFLHC